MASAHGELRQMENIKMCDDKSLIDAATSFLAKTEQIVTDSFPSKAEVKVGDVVTLKSEKLLLGAYDEYYVPVLMTVGAIDARGAECYWISGGSLESTFLPVVALSICTLATVTKE